jgi:hypothetical protein
VGRHINNPKNKVQEIGGIKSDKIMWMMRGRSIGAGWWIK